MFSSQEFWNNVYATPFHYLEMLFAFLAALSFLVFLRGFLGSIGNVFKMNAHDEHVEHAQVRQIWGIYLLIALFAVWEIVRSVASWFGFNDGGETSLGYWFAGIIALYWIYDFVAVNLFGKKKKKGGH